MSENREQPPPVPSPDFLPVQPTPRERVATPANALIVVACLGVMGNCGTSMFLHALDFDPRPAARPPGMDDEIFRASELGRDSAPVIDLCLTGCFSLCLYSLVLAGGLQMRNLRHHWLAMAACVVAALPCGPACILGLPIGVWAAVVLYEPDVKSAFTS